MKELDYNTVEYDRAYSTLKAIDDQLNELDTLEDVEAFIDNTLSISVIHDIYNHTAEGFIIDITVGGPYIYLDTRKRVLKYVSPSGDLAWSPRFEKIKLIDDYINDYLYQI